MSRPSIFPGMRTGSDSVKCSKKFAANLKIADGYRAASSVWNRSIPPILRKSSARFASTPSPTPSAPSKRRRGFSPSGAPHRQRSAPRSCADAAEVMRRRRWELAAWEVFEVGKGWREADADVTEAIDYLDYYAHEMLRLAAPRETQVLPSESNVYFYEPRGVAAVIAPWNFPLAILTGMTAAALVTGNCALMKPAEQSPVMALHLLDILREAGLPDDACQLLQGGGELGAHLVRSAKIHLIAFTGSREVGLEILREAYTHRPGQAHVKRVVCEMGGKNAVIVDNDADLDEAVVHIIDSAFGYQGQKCSAASRIILAERCSRSFAGAVGRGYAQSEDRPAGRSAQCHRPGDRSRSATAHRRIYSNRQARSQVRVGNGCAGRRILRRAGDFQ